MQPLAHQILRDALRQCDWNPRGAHVLGIMALEVGVKSLVERLVPDSGWLLTNSPSPPIADVLSDYLTGFRSQSAPNQKIQFRDEVIKSVKNAVSMRNGLVHRSSSAPTSARVGETLSLVRDVLWLLDVYGGYKWAEEYVSSTTSGLSQLNW